jgi:hypothetical protein
MKKYRKPSSPTKKYCRKSTSLGYQNRKQPDESSTSSKVLPREAWKQLWLPTKQKLRLELDRLVIAWGSYAKAKRFQHEGPFRSLPGSRVRRATFM